MKSVFEATQGLVSLVSKESGPSAGRVSRDLQKQRQGGGVPAYRGQEGWGTVEQGQVTVEGGWDREVSSATPLSCSSHLY